MQPSRIQLIIPEINQSINTCLTTDHECLGDCYIVMHCVEKNGAYSRDIHFWLGNESSVDERGAAALYTVRLDDLFGGEPTQHREVQGHESGLFLSYFKSGIRYLEGGIESAFRTVDRDAFTSRLFHLKGKREVRAAQVAISAKSLNEGDVFVLDQGRKIYIWNGSSANRYEKIRAAEFARRIRDEERGGNAELIFIQSAQAGASSAADCNASPADIEAFWAALGGSPADVQPAIDDDDLSAGFNPKLYKVVVPADWTASKGAEGVQFETVAESKLDKAMLNSSNLYIVDASTQVYVWVGSSVGREQRQGSLILASRFLGAERELSTAITRVDEGVEAVGFTSLFDNWPRAQSGPSSGLGARFDAEAKQISEASQPKIDNLAVLANRKSQGFGLPHEGNIEIWRIENFRRVPYPKEKYAHFYAGDSYIIQFTYLIGGAPAHMLYFWQGEDSTADERGASAFLTVSVSDELGGVPQVRVVQGKEPKHFLAIFKGQMIVHKGGVASGFTSANPEGAPADTSSEEPTTAVSLYQIKSTSPLVTRTVETNPVAASLNSGDVFMLVPNTPETHAQTNGSVLVWRGSGSNKEERETGEKLARSLVETKFRGVTGVTLVEEGQESEVFWSLLGGKGEYANVKTADDDDRYFEPRLFHCSDARGRGLIVEEIFNWSQDDLINDDVMILDAGTEIFVWIGSESTQEEKEGSKKLAMEFIEKSPEARLGKDTPIYQIFAGQEPPNFTSHFVGWDASKQKRDYSALYKDMILAAAQARAAAAAAEDSAKGTNLLQQARASLTTTKPLLPATATPEPAPSGQTTSEAAAAGPQPPRKSRDQVVAAGYLDPQTNKFPLEVLRTSVPEGVDPTCKDMYLSNEELESLVGLPAVQYKLLARWRQLEILESKKF